MYSDLSTFSFNVSALASMCQKEKNFNEHLLDAGWAYCVYLFIIPTVSVFTFKSSTQLKLILARSIRKSLYLLFSREIIFLLFIGKSVIYSLIWNINLSICLIFYPEINFWGMEDKVRVGIHFFLTHGKEAAL